MICISPIQSWNQTSIIVIFCSNVATSIYFASKVIGLRTRARVGACLGDAEVNAWARTIVVLLIVSDKIAAVFMNFPLLELFRFCFWVLAFKAIELGYPGAVPNTPDYISEIGLLSKPKSILLCNLIASNIFSIFVFLFFIYSSQLFRSVFSCFINCSTATLKSSYFTWVSEPICSFTNLWIRVFTYCIIIFLGSIKS